MVIIAKIPVLVVGKHVLQEIVCAVVKGVLTIFILTEVILVILIILAIIAKIPVLIVGKHALPIK